MPNIALLQQTFDSKMLDAVVESNQRFAAAVLGTAAD
jgi:hypothetical protein